VSTASLVEPARPAERPAGSTISEAPYVGPRPFLSTDCQRFFGRDREAIDLKHRVMAHPITLLYAMSGAGKTSLVNARLIPDLESQGCHVLPVARVRGSSSTLDHGETGNIYVLEALFCWQRQSDAGTPARLEGRTLKGELAPLAKLADQDDALLIAVFDQFEELFTAYASRWDERRGFFEQLADALESLSNLRVLLAMREDWLASLDPFASLVPENLRTRFRLERLRREAALEAVVKPLEGTGRNFGAGVAETLINNLMTIRVGRPRDGSKARVDNVDAGIPATAGGLATAVGRAPGCPPEREGYVARSEYVEPVQMQVVCQTLWSNLEAGEAEITAEHLERCGDVNQALSRFYDDCVKQASQVSLLREGDVRRWFDERLITPAGTRGLVLRESNTTGDLHNDAVDALESCHLIRGEDRGGARWYELSHDRFIEPVRNSNRHWESTRRGQALWSELNRRAATWDAAPAEKKPSLLLTRADLGRADAWSKTESSELGVSDLVKRFLDDSRAAIDRAEMADQLARERRAARDKARAILFLACGAAGLASLLALALVGWSTANANNKRAERYALEAQSQAKNALAQKVLANENEVLAENEKNKATVSRWAMRATLEKEPASVLGDIQEVIRIAERKRLSQFEEGTQQSIRNALSHLTHRSQLGPYNESVNEVAFAPRSWVDAVWKGTAGPVVAVGGRDGLVELWDMGDYDNPDDDKSKAVIKPPLVNPGKSGWVNRIVFAHAGRMLAFCTGDTASVNAADRGGAWVWTAPELPDGQGHLHPLESDSDTGPVADVAFSPDGATVATAGSRGAGSANKPAVDGVWQGVVRVYDAPTRKLLYEFTLKGPARSVAFDRKGRRLVAASGDASGDHTNLPGQVVVYTLDTGNSITMKDYERPSVRALFSPDGKAVVSGGVDGIGRVHDPKTGDLIATLVGHSQSITALDFSHDGTRLVTASGDRTARIWDPSSWSGSRDGLSPSTWSSQVTLVGHKASLLHAEFSPDSTLVLTSSYDRTARVWDAQTGECLVSHVGHDGAVNVARFSSRGFILATAGSDRTARVWMTGPVETPRLMLAGHEAALRDVEFSPKPGSYLALTAGADGVACLWDVSGLNNQPGSIAPIRRFAPPTAPAALTDLAFSPDGERFATASVDGTVRVWQIASETQPEVIVPQAGAALGVTFSPKGTYLLTSWADDKMRLYRRDGNDYQRVADPWPGSAFRLSPQLFDKDERVLVTPNAGLLRIKGDTGSVVIWDVATRECVQALKGPGGLLGPVSDLAVRMESRTIAAATASASGTVVAWDEHGRLIGAPLWHAGGVERVAFSPDGKSLATEAEDGIGRIWDWPLRDGQKPTASLTGLTGPSPVLAFSDDGSRIVSDGGYLATDTGACVAQIWHLSGQPPASGGPATFLRGPRDSVVALSLRRAEISEVLTINRENRLQRWSTDSGDSFGSCRGPHLIPTAAAVSPDGSLAVSGTGEGALVLWTTHRARITAELKAHTAGITSVSFSRDGRSILSTGRDGKACVWSAPDRDAQQLPLQTAGPVSLSPRATFSPEGGRVPITVARFLDPAGKRLVTGTGDLERKRWQPEKEIDSQALAYRLDLTSAGFRTEKLVAVQKLEGDTGADDAPRGALAAAVSPTDSRVFVACGGSDSKFDLVWCADPFTSESGSKLYLGHTDPILDVAVSPDGRRMATASADNTARIWTIDRSKVVELRGHSGDVHSVAFSPGNEFILTVSRQDGTARVWERDGGDPLYVLGTRRAGLNSATLDDPPGPRQYTDDVVAAAFSSDGKVLITAHGDGNARVYRLELCGGFDDLKEVAKKRRDGFKNKPRSGEGQARGRSH
jgi:WD40 repeat protein